MRKPYTSLRMRMVECDTTQGEIAERIGVGRSYLCDRMLGKRPFDTDLIQQIAGVLNIPQEDYYKYFFDRKPGGGGKRSDG